MANNQSVRRHLDAFTRGRIIGKLEEGRSVTSVAAEFGIAHSIVSRLWRQFQTTGTAIRGFSSGRPRGTTPADDRFIVLQARRNRRQTAGEIARHTTQATGRPISRFTVARRLHSGGLFARRPVRCVPLTPAHRRRRSLWCREHRNWRDNEWGRVLFTDESRFSLSSDSHRILIWRERGSRNRPSNIIERDRYGGHGVLVWRGIMLGSRTDLHIFDAGSVNGTRYCNEILLPYVRLFRGAMGLQFLFMDDNAPCHRTVTAEQLLESRRLAARTLPPVTIRELQLALQDEWAAMPQQLIDTLILSMGRRCETCLADLNRFLETGSAGRRPGQGRRRATTPNEDRYLVLTARRHRNENAILLQQHLRSATGTTVSTQTVLNRLHDVGLYACRPMSRFSVHPDNRRIFIWRERGSRNKPAFMYESVRFGSGGVLVYGGISIDGRTDLYIIRDGPLTPRRYSDEILRPIVVPYAAAIGDDFILMDDNCRPHRANLVEDFLFEEGIVRMEWPACSPDMNPIEHVWDALGRRVAGRQPPPQTLQKLERALLEEWDRIPQLVINSLIDSMPQRCSTLLVVRGKDTPY
ncbi:transposable element Tcb2 transposase [Trichonephila clavipes]|nr:transposable element Tcb2 transposase [Trichonephila clavipes]